MNRLTKIDFPSDTDITYAYDSCVNGKGRLCTVSDQSGSTTYEYTKKGQITKETRNIDGVAYLTQYTYDQNGNTRTVTYPSGRVITYNYTNSRVNGVLNNAASLASGITYKPFGGINTITFGYDNQYRIASIQAGSLQSLTYGYDAGGNVTGIVNNLDNTKNKSYTYDNLDRLATATGPWGSLSWTLDPVGNRLTQVDGSGTSSYTYATGSNKLSAITGANPASFTSDANGNTLSENAKIFTYNQNQRLIQAASTQTGNYVYNANGQRVKKTVGGAVTIYHYDQNGQLIAESSNTGAVQAEYVYLNGIPLAKIDGSGTQYIHTDHLGTPVMMTDAARAIVWEIENRPFGDGATVTGTATLNLRFPGQYYDAESGLNYNYFRDYNPAVGRYIQADPIGLDGGINSFEYVEGNPVNWVDTLGLLTDARGTELGAGAGKAISVSLMTVADTEGNIGIMVGLGFGGMSGVSASATKAVQVTNAKNIYELRGWSTQVGASGGAGIYTIGGNAILSPSYKGGQINYGAGKGLTAAEIHMLQQFSFVTGFNLKTLIKNIREKRKLRKKLRKISSDFRNS